MSTLDTGFFFVEHKSVPMHLGSLMVFGGPAPAYRDIAGPSGARRAATAPARAVPPGRAAGSGGAHGS